MGWSTCVVHDGVYQGLQLLDLALSKILVLIMWLTLPIINAICAQNFFDLVADFHLGSITYELGGSTAGPDLVFQGIDELPIRLNGVDIGGQ